MKKTFILLLLIFVNGSLLKAQTTISMKNGMVLKGEIVSEGDSLIVLKTKYGQRSISISSIEKIQRPEDEQVTIELKDGNVFKGNILKDDGENILLKTVFGEIEIKKSNIAIKSGSSNERNVIVKLNDGSVMKGILLEESESSLKLKTNFGELILDKINVKSIDNESSEEISRDRLVEEIKANPAEYFYGSYEVKYPSVNGTAIVENFEDVIKMTITHTTLVRNNFAVYKQVVTLKKIRNNYYEGEGTVTMQDENAPVPFASLLIKGWNYGDLEIDVYTSKRFKLFGKKGYTRIPGKLTSNKNNTLDSRLIKANKKMIDK